MNFSTTRKQTVAGCAEEMESSRSKDEAVAFIPNREIFILTPSQSQAKKEPRKISTISILIALLPLPIYFCVAWIIFPLFVHKEIENRIGLTPEINEEFYNAWLNPPIPMYLRLYIFNVTNAQDVGKGSLPKLEELGPYVFQSFRNKTILEEDEETITYQELFNYTFREDLSNGLRLTDKVTIINVPYVSAAIIIEKDYPWPVKDVAKMVLLSNKEPLFIQKSVNEVLFKGWKVPFLEKMEKDVGVSMIPNNTFGFFAGQNNSVHGPLTVNRGLNDKQSVGAILKYKNETKLYTWAERNSSCNKIMGSDGTIFPPFLDKTSILRLFNYEACHSIYMTFSETVEYKGIEGYRFKVPLEAIGDPREGQNECFCSGYEDMDGECLKEGALNLGPCKDGAPVAVTRPHFLDAYKEYLDEGGLKPEREKHESFMDIEPTTGVFLRGRTRAQINLILRKVKDIRILKNVPEMLFPLFWAEQEVELNDEYVGKFKYHLNLLFVVNSIARWGLLGLALIASVAIFKRFNK